MFRLFFDVSEQFCESIGIHERLMPISSSSPPLALASVPTAGDSPLKTYYKMTPLDDLGVTDTETPRFPSMHKEGGEEEEEEESSDVDGKAMKMSQSMHVNLDETEVEEQTTKAGAARCSDLLVSETRPGHRTKTPSSSSPPYSPETSPELPAGSPLAARRPHVESGAQCVRRRVGTGRKCGHDLAADRSGGGEEDDDQELAECRGADGDGE